VLIVRDDGGAEVHTPEMALAVSAANSIEDGHAQR
jgi:hypothetical protein